MYADFANLGDELLKEFGLSMKVARAGVSVGSGFGMFVGGTTKDETKSSSSVLAQTSQTVKSLLLSGLAKAPQVGDVLTADKTSWTVTEVETIRPTNITVLYKLEVI